MLQPETIAPFDQKIVEIRGFLYQSAKKEWVLSSEPDLKSCCLGTEKNRNKQIFIAGDFDKALHNKLVTVRGKFWIDPTKEFYHLEVHSLLPQESKIGLTSMMILSCIGMIFGLFSIKKIKKRG